MTANIEAALGRVAIADDFTISSAFADLHRLLHSSFGAPLEELERGLPEELKFIDGKVTLGFFESAAAEELDDQESLRIARRLFALAAVDEDIAPTVVDVLDSFSDDRQMVGEILAIGAVGAVWLIIASTAFSFKTSSGQVRKDKVSPALIKSFADLVRSVRRSTKSLT